MRYSNKYVVPSVMEYTGNTSTAYKYHGADYNAGDAVECAVVTAAGLAWAKDSFTYASQRQDLFDAERGYCAAIKTYRATLASPSLLGDTPDNKPAAVAVFMNKCPAKEFIWGRFIDGGRNVECYTMNREQFRAFVLSECWKVNGGKIRQLYGPGKTVKWFES